MRAAALALVFAAVAGAAPPAPDPVFVRFERTACFGTCPIYAIKITRGGVLRYAGTRFVKTIGRNERRLSATQVADLRAAFARAHFVDLAEHCCDCTDVTDMPGAVITWVADGVAKTIRDYHGCRAAPEAIRTLEDDVDRIVGIESLIGKPEERRAGER